MKEKGAAFDLKFAAAWYQTRWFIGSEAIRKACLHSGETRVEVEIESLSDLKRSVRANVRASQ